MAKRKAARPKRPTLRDRAKISAKSFAKLKREAENARRRIREFSKRSDADNYFIPDADDYKLASLINRIANGESVRAVMRDVVKVTAERIRSGILSPFISNTGYKITPSDKQAIVKAVNTANKNIREAKRLYPDFTDIMPQEFKIKDILGDIISSQTIENRLKDLSLFTIDNLFPTAVNEAGEAGTFAEYQYYKNILMRENERRASLREEMDPTKNEGFFIQQANYDTQEINIESIPSMDLLRKRATTWDDPARIYRANLFLSNYEKTLDMFAGVLINNGFWNDVIEDRVKYIREIIGQLYYNEQAITFVSSRMPNIDIALLYDAGNGDVDFNAIYEAWIDIEDMYLM